MNRIEQLARAMCRCDGWADPDQTAHIRDGPNNTRRMPRWQAYVGRVELMLKAIEAADLLLLPRQPETDAWRVAAADSEPAHPLGSHENRRLADRAMAIFEALARRHRSRDDPR